jgi:thiol-disulfide isomerase/thioredoxin
MNVKFAAGAVSVVVMALIMIAGRFSNLVEAASLGSTVKCSIDQPTVAPEPDAAQEREFDEYVHKPGRLSVVVFYSRWCYPCIQTKQLVESFGKEFSDYVAVKCVNVDQAASLAASHRVTHVPDIRLFRMGTQVDAFTGGMSEEEVRAKLLAHAAPHLADPPLATMPGSTRATLGKGTIEPMKKGWLPPGIEKR